ncbi:MAG TPA: ABC transporter permease [Pyrinomonadaceae bacterium]|nr:ABC transporter permease [Pyrinomonadaceae bacterium]
MPDWKDEVKRRLRGLQVSPVNEAEIVEELAQHLDDVYQRALRNGASEENARRAALNELNAEHSLLNELQRTQKRPPANPPLPGESRRLNLLADFLQDLRYASRMLLKNPGFTAVAVIALALGIGANTAIFSVVNTVLLRPLPYKDPEQLVMVWEDASRHGYPRDTPAAANFVDWRDQNSVFSGMAAIADMNFNLTGVGDPERLKGRRVSANLFPLLGVDPQFGRVFTAAEDQPGAQRVVLLSHRLWLRRFGGDQSIVSKSLTLNGENYTVVGVMPARFQFPENDDELWVPIALTAEEAANRNRHYLQVLARLKPGVTLEQAQSEMTTIGARLQQQYPQSNADLGVAVTSLHEHLVGDIKPALLILLGAVGLVLLIACANVANLLLARAAIRQKEIALRVALGARRWRLLRQFLTESVLLATLGGILGLAIAYAGLLLLGSFIPENIAQAREISLDLKVLGFTLGVSLLTGFVFGLAPAIQALRMNQSETLKEGGRDSVTGRSGKRLRGLLVTAEVAVSLVLLIAAGLLINSFLRLRNIDPGFKVDRLLTMKIELPEPKYEEFERRTAFYTDLIQRVQSLAGVRSAAVTTNLPLYRQGNSTSIRIEGRPDPPPGQELIVVTRIVSPAYFDTMSIPLLAGRQFTDQDTDTTPNAVVISETMARRYWPGEEAIGKRIVFGRARSEADWIQVIGIVKDVRQFELNAEPRPQLYMSYRQAGFFAPEDLVVKTDVEPASMAAAVRKAVWEIDKDQPVSNIKTMEEILGASIARQRFSMLLLGVFAGVALLLAAVGIYGVMSYSVAQRTHEIGIRMALGAQTGAVLKLAVGYGLKLVVAGVLIGLVAAFMLTRLMSTLLFGVTPTDPVTFALISLLLVGVAAVASYIPARRATKVDPLIALRYE